MMVAHLFTGCLWQLW